jgi:hypothetical protein
MPVRKNLIESYRRGSGRYEGFFLHGSLRRAESGVVYGLCRMLPNFNITSFFCVVPEKPARTACDSMYYFCVDTEEFLAAAWEFQEIEID